MLIFSQAGVSVFISHMNMSVLSAEVSKITDMPYEEYLLKFSAFCILNDEYCPFDEVTTVGVSFPL